MKKGGKETVCDMHKNKAEHKMFNAVVRLSVNVAAMDKKRVNYAKQKKEVDVVIGQLQKISSSLGKLAAEKRRMAKKRKKVL